MRTTVEINDELLREAKARASKEDATLKEIVDRALRQYLQPNHRDRPPLVWTAISGRMLPEVNLEDRDALYELMEPVEELRDRYRH